MTSGPHDPVRLAARERRQALDGPAEDEFELSGPGPGAGDAGRDGIDDERRTPDAHLPGGVDHTTAAVGGGGVGVVLLGIAGAFKHRWARRRYEDLDE